MYLWVDVITVLTLSKSGRRKEVTDSHLDEKQQLESKLKDMKEDGGPVSYSHTVDDEETH